MKAIGNIGIFCSPQMWKTVVSAKVEYAFACVFLVALNELEYVLVEERHAVGRGDAAGSAASADSRAATLYLEHVTAITVEHTDLHVVDQLAPSLHFLKDESSYFLLAETLAVLGKMLKLAPEDFALLVANSDIMAILQTVFRYLRIYLN